MPVVPDEVLDHFKIWELMPAPLADPIHVEDTYQVILKDQFHTKDGITRTIRRIEWIANPPATRREVTRRNDDIDSCRRRRDSLPPTRRPQREQRAPAKAWTGLSTFPASYLMASIRRCS